MQCELPKVLKLSLEARPQNASLKATAIYDPNLLCSGISSIKSRIASLNIIIPASTSWSPLGQLSPRSVDILSTSIYLKLYLSPCLVTGLPYLLTGIATPFCCLGGAFGFGFGLAGSECRCPISSIAMLFFHLRHRSLAAL